MRVLKIGHDNVTMIGGDCTKERGSLNFSTKKRVMKNKNPKVSVHFQTIKQIDSTIRQLQMLRKCMLSTGIPYGDIRDLHLSVVRIDLNEINKEGDNSKRTPRETLNEMLARLDAQIRRGQPIK